MLGKSNTTGRDSYMLFGPDGELMSVKWKMYKTILRYSEGVDKPIVKPQFPMFYDLSSDPHEDWNLFATRLDNGWMMAPVFRAIMQYEMSVKRYPNIKPGEDFKGGEFVMTEQRPRMQTRAMVLPLEKGDAAIFAVNSRPMKGLRGDYQVKLNHGVSKLYSGKRHTLGVIFHDAL